MQQDSLNKDDPPQESSIHVSHAQTKKGFKRKKGENPIEILTDIMLYNRYVFKIGKHQLTFSKRLGRQFISLKKFI